MRFYVKYIIGISSFVYLETCAETETINFQPIEHFTQENSHQQDSPTAHVIIPQTFDELFQHANTLFSQKNYPEAITYYKQALAHRQTCPQVFFNMGLAYLHLNNKTAAAHAFDQAVTYKLDYTKAHVQLAKVSQQLGEPEKAIEHYQKAIHFEPDWSEPRLLLARLYNKQHKFPQSVIQLKQALSREPNNRSLLFELANTYNTINKLTKALEIYKQLLSQEPNNPSFLYNTAYTLKKMGDIEKALPYYDKAIMLKPDHSEAHFSRGLAYLTTGDFERGWAEYEWRWNKPNHGSKRDYPQPRWDGTPLEGKTILFHAEQGLGDTFQFIRYAQVAKKRGGHVIAAVQSQLVAILSLCPYLDQVISLNDTPPHFDVHAPLMSLPFILKTTIDTIPCDIPYLYADQALVEYWQEELAQDHNFKVGICWQGNSNYSTPFLRAVVAQKSVNVNQLLPLNTIPGVSLYNLQKVTGEDQLKTLSPDFKLYTFDGDFDSSHGRFMDTAAVMKNLDLVITVDTSICHLAAGLGIPTWNILPNPADWRWMINRTDTPWYPTIRLFRQPTIGDWDSVINEIVHELHKRVHGTEYVKPVMEEKSPSSIQKQLTHEKEMVTNKMQMLWAHMQHEQLDDAAIEQVKQLYLLNQIRKMINEKIAVLHSVRPECFSS